MSATFQAIIGGARAVAPGVSPTSSGMYGTAGWECSQLGIRPRDRRPALAIR
ncbi:hypothetical protein [Streptomyces albidus (ex Kaewkla and Franco 2022)]|uniref:hypothetical protein n=1 Tax=Streptomyces albidus (ex Kaewkla and Franco 2022) TaxID=722709 RepID=UPI0015EED785|nr:hypothetical protein [Streptomyces albidus (ex Kaewkla and Franco 2022)]